MNAYYDVRQEAHREAWHTTPGATPEDWDKALQVAQERAASQGRNYVVRHVGRERTLLIVTATPDEGLAWPKVAVPPLQPGELDREVEEPGRVVQAVSHDAALEALNDLERQADREAEL